jgi:hypothetical protein
MPPAHPGRRRPYPGDSRSYADRPSGTAAARPPVIEYDALRGLPLAVQALATAALLPLEVAVTSVKVLKNAEALLEELVLHLRALRPAVAAMSEAYADGHFDPMFRTFDQIQQSTSAMGVIWAPITAVRQAVAPGQPRQVIAAQPAVAAPAVPVVEPAPPTMAEWIGGLGGLGGRVLNQAVALPGALRGSVPRLGATPGAEASGVQGPPVRGARVTGDPARAVNRDGEPGPEPPAGWAVPLVPGPIRRLFGG